MFESFDPSSVFFQSLSMSFLRSLLSQKILNNHYFTLKTTLKIKYKFTNMFILNSYFSSIPCLF